jgi:hypothetical protein
MNLRGGMLVSIAVIGMLAGCRLTGTQPETVAPPSAVPSSPESPADSGSGLTEDEAIAAASEVKTDPGSVFVDAIHGSVSEVDPSLPDVLDRELEVWVVTFSGEYDIACDDEECPLAGTEQIVLDHVTGEFLLTRMRGER